jgi:hypothetical protein
MTFTEQLASAMAEVIAHDPVTVTKPGGGTFTARRNRGEAATKEMRDAGYMADAELLLIATASALSAASYTPAVNDEITVSSTVYVILNVRTDAAFTHIRAQKEK